MASISNYHTIYIAYAMDEYNCFPMLSKCTHSLEEQNGNPMEQMKEFGIWLKDPRYGAMSVVLASILYTTTKFNALQILIDSQKFDMSEPIIYYWRNYSNKTWYLVAMSPVGLAILMDRCSTSFVLLKTLKRNSLLKMDMEFCFMELATDSVFNRWKASRASNLLSFLVDCIDYESTKFWYSFQNAFFPETIRALHDLDILCLQPTTRSSSLHRDIRSVHFI